MKILAAQSSSVAHPAKIIATDLLINENVSDIVNFDYLDTVKIVTT